MIRIAAIADVHCHTGARGLLKPMFDSLSGAADILLVGGDLSVTGSLSEARVLIRELEDLHIPIVTVLGNHDYESRQEEAFVGLLRDQGIVVLDGDSVTYEIDGETVGIAGTKGFCGGFDKYLLAPFGERAIKEFVQESLREVHGIEQALGAIEADYRVVLLHYAPIRQTLAGESLEIYPFLGSSRLARPIDAIGADVVFHGHAHYGSPRGTTKSGIPVLNVAKPVVGDPVIWTLSRRPMTPSGPAGEVHYDGAAPERKHVRSE